MSADEMSARDTMWQMTNAYQASQAIHVAAALGIADLLGDGPKGAEELAKVTGAHAHALYRLLRALAGDGVFAEQADGRGRSPVQDPGFLSCYRMLAEVLRSCNPLANRNV